MSSTTNTYLYCTVHEINQTCPTCLTYQRNGVLGMRRLVVLIKFLTSLNACVPGLHLLFLPPGHWTIGITPFWGVTNHKTCKQNFTLVNIINVEHIVINSTVQYTSNTSNTYCESHESLAWWGALGV